MNNKGREVVHGIDWFAKEYGVKSSTHSGKMTGIPSYSTSCLENERCAMYRHCDGSICEKCFAHAYMGFRKGLRESMQKNGEMLKSRVFEMDELPIINAAFFRYESFGDLDAGEKGITQARNYLRIARKNPHVRFGWWTKNPDILDKAIKAEGGYTKNISFVVSSIMINEVRDVSKFPWVNVVFTVYSPAYLAEHPEIKINCGTRQCLGCLQCYKAHKKLVYVNELLK